jgi:glycosyltransferase involved in cell wall biosynthesis
LVSIVTPTYNRRDYLAVCIESVLAQTFPNWEQIIVDDGSIDETDRLVGSYRDPRLRYVFLEHRGIDHLGETYNRGLQAARGEYVAILESDDFWPPDKLSRQIASFQQPGVVLSYGRAALVDATGRTFAITPPPPRNPSIRSNTPPAAVLKRLLFHNFIIAATVMIRRQTLEEVGGFLQPSYCQCVDLPTYLAVSLKGTFAYVDARLGFWRRHLGQNTFLNTRQVLLSGCRYAREFFEHARQNGALPPELEMLEAEFTRYEARIEEYVRFVEGRLLLVQGRWREARQAFLGLRRARWIALRAAAFLGLTGCLLHFDIEGFCRRAGIYSFPPRRIGHL